MLPMHTAPRLRMSALVLAWLLTACSQEPPTAESSLEAARGASRGIVAVETVATNQRDERVLSFRRKVLVPKRTHATLGVGKVPA